MKPFNEISKNPRIAITKNAPDGIQGLISLPLWQGTVIASNGAGWEHVSVAPFKRRTTPTWDDMCKIKSWFWEDDEAVIQIHPKSEEYVNNMSNCLHLWRCTYKDMILPPSCLVGLRNGQTIAELQQEIREAYEIAGEKLGG